MAVKHTPIPSKDFETEKLMKLSEPELRAEYSRLRSTANKRLTTFEKSEFRDSETYRYNRGRYVKLDEIKNKSELVNLLVDAKRFLTGERGSVTGQKRIRAEYIKTMRKKGLDWLNTGNYYQWLDFLEFVKEKVGFAYETKEIAEIFDESGKIKEEIPSESSDSKKTTVDRLELAKQAFEKYQQENTIE